MKLGRLNHIGVATPSIAASIVHYRNVMDHCINPAKTL
jgi:methylmalonyl-CoA/ethylmalonyl-CoA epimerase